MTAMTQRCAIYTRKSSEEGLEQDFNSLQAQREACEAYIHSQKHEGWRVLPTHYDDGGVSGGTMDRPALAALLEAIRKRQIDTVVVYKVDRLTRALNDFAKIVEIFDAHDVSFVSVTQQFNTTTSMGRLTLNVLLSFAQFEREVTGERIRDKIAASKKKGMWMGGTVPHGYRVEDRRLVVDKSQAEEVRTIFSLYLKHGKVSDTTRDVNKQGITSRNGKRFSQGNLYRILQNPAYLGKVRHRDRIYDGQHEPIIAQATWDAVQAQIDANRVRRRHGTNVKHPSLLARLVKDEAGRSFISSWSSRAAFRYRYYVEQFSDEAIEKHPKRRKRRIPAGELESAVIEQLCALLDAPDRLAEVIGLAKPTIAQSRHLEHQGKHLVKELAQGDIHAQRVHISEWLKAVIVGQDHLTLEVDRSNLKHTLEMDDIEKDPPDRPYTIRMPIRFENRGVEVRVITEDKAGQAHYDPALIKAVVKAQEWFGWLVSGEMRNFSDIARKENVTDSYVRYIVNLAFLKPDIVDQILNGIQPYNMTADELIKRNGLPLDWLKQNKYFLEH